MLGNIRHQHRRETQPVKLQRNNARSGRSREATAPRNPRKPLRQKQLCQTTRLPNFVQDAANLPLSRSIAHRSHPQRPLGWAEPHRFARENTTAGSPRSADAMPHRLPRPLTQPLHAPPLIACFSKQSHPTRNAS